MDPYIIRTGLNIMTSSVCVNCFPHAKASIGIWFGNSLCKECLIIRRKSIDELGHNGAGYDGIPLIEKRDYKATWGEEIAEVV